VHLLQRLVHVLHMMGSVGEEHLAVAHRAAEHAELVGGAEGSGKQAVGVQALEPLAVEPSGFGPSGGPFGLPWVEQHDLEATGFQEFE
jgi:hypothetical protein